MCLIIYHLASPLEENNALSYMYLSFFCHFLVSLCTVFLWSEIFLPVSFFFFEGKLLMSFIAFLAATLAFASLAAASLLGLGCAMSSPRHLKCQCQTVAGTAIWSLLDKRHDSVLVAQYTVETFENTVFFGLVFGLRVFHNCR